LRRGFGLKGLMCECTSASIEQFEFKHRHSYFLPFVQAKTVEPLACVCAVGLQHWHMSANCRQSAVTPRGSASLQPPTALSAPLRTLLAKYVKSSPFGHYGW